MVGDDVKVTVLRIRGNQVVLGIEAPEAIPVHREEIYNRIQEEKGGGPEEKEEDPMVRKDNPEEGDRTSAPRTLRPHPSLSAAPLTLLLEAIEEAKSNLAEDPPAVAALLAQVRR